MSIATDFAAYGMATKQVTVTTTSTLITGAAGLAAEAIPAEATHIAIQPESGNVYWAMGTASEDTPLVPSGGLIFNAPSAPALRTIQLYSPTGATCQIVFGGITGRVVLGDAANSEAYDAGEPFTLLVDESVLASGLTDPAPVAAKAEVIGTAAHGVLNCRGKSVARIMFGGTNAADEIFDYQVILWSQTVGSSVTAAAWIPRVIAKGVVTLGDDVYAAGGAGMGAATNFFADTITDTILDGATVYRVAEQRAVLEIPLHDSERIEIQTALATAAGADAFCQLGHAAGGGGTATGSAMFYEDEAHVSGDPGRMFLCVRTDTRASLAGTDGDYAPPQMNANGELRVVDDALVGIPVAKSATSLVQVLAGTPAPIALVAAQTYATAFRVQAARADADNAGDVFIGLVTDLVSGTKNYFKLTPGANFEWVCRPGTKVDMNLWGIDGETAADGVIGVYEPV